MSVGWQTTLVVQEGDPIKMPPFDYDDKREAERVAVRVAEAQGHNVLGIKETVRFEFTTNGWKVPR